MRSVVDGTDPSDVEPQPHPIAHRRRSRRHREIRATTISINRLTKREIELGRELYPDVGELEPLPKTRGDCENDEGPCPFVSCKHHLYLDVSEDSGAIKLNFPDLEVWEIPETCALRVAAKGGATLEEVGVYLNVTRERVRQVERRAIESIPRKRLRLLAECASDAARESVPARPSARIEPHEAMGTVHDPNAHPWPKRFTG